MVRNQYKTNKNTFYFTLLYIFYAFCNANDTFLKSLNEWYLGVEYFCFCDCRCNLSWYYCGGEDGGIYELVSQSDSVLVGDSGGETRVEC